jgi:ubiquitin carboxyl-terminal hydrolase 43
MRFCSQVRIIFWSIITDGCLLSPQSIVSKYASQFRGNSQHDALEFLLWLLDRVHEDASAKTNGSSKVGHSIWSAGVLAV